MAKSTVAPWLYGFKTKGSRMFALSLSAADALFSYQGLLRLQYPYINAICLALLIFFFQASVGLLLTGGVPIGEMFEERFFKDKGIVGAIKRVVGVCFLIVAASFYGADIVTNYAALNGGLIWRGAIDLIDFIFSIAFSIGDELLHLLADFLSSHEAKNLRDYQDSQLETQVDNTYITSYKGKALQVAGEIGEAHGAEYQPARFSRGSKGGEHGSARRRKD